MSQFDSTALLCDINGHVVPLVDALLSIGAAEKVWLVTSFVLPKASHFAPTIVASQNQNPTSAAPSLLVVTWCTSIVTIITWHTAEKALPRTSWPCCWVRSTGIKDEVATLAETRLAPRRVALGSRTLFVLVFVHAPACFKTSLNATFQLTNFHGLVALPSIGVCQRLKTRRRALTPNTPSTARANFFAGQFFGCRIECCRQ